MTSNWSQTTAGPDGMRERRMKTQEWATDEAPGAGGNRVVYTARENAAQGLNILCNGVRTAQIMPTGVGHGYVVRPDRWTHLASNAEQYPNGQKLTDALDWIVHRMQKRRLTREWSSHFLKERAEQTAVDRFFEDGHDGWR